MDAAPLGQTVRRCGSDVEWGLHVRRRIADDDAWPQAVPKGEFRSWLVAPSLPQEVAGCGERANELTITAWPGRELA